MRNAMRLAQMVVRDRIGERYVVVDYSVEKEFDAYGTHFVPLIHSITDSSTGRIIDDDDVSEAAYLKLCDMVKEEKEE